MSHSNKNDAACLTIMDGASDHTTTDNVLTREKKSDNNYLKQIIEFPPPRDEHIDHIYGGMVSQQQQQHSKKQLIFPNRRPVVPKYRTGGTTVLLLRAPFGRLH